MLPVGTPKRSVVLASLLGATLIAVAVALNISWVILNWRTGILLVVGAVSFAVLIVGLVLNTGFLVREIRRSERHDAFINVVTHELKTPLASIQLYLQTLQRRDVDPTRRQAFIDIMLADSDRLQATIDQILLAGKMGATRRPVNQTDVDLRNLTADCVETASTRHHLDVAQLRFENRVREDDEAIVAGDLDEIRAAVSNLIDNAIKYSGAVIDVTVELTKPGSHRLAIVVKDRGVGIDPGELPQIFRRFYRIPSLRGATPKGTGLGLSIVAAVARRHGGRAFADSEGTGRGSTFTLELPLKLS